MLWSHLVAVFVADGFDECPIACNKSVYGVFGGATLMLSVRSAARLAAGRVLGSWYSCRLFLGSGFWLGARWNRLGEAAKTRKKREKTVGKWAI